MKRKLLKVQDEKKNVYKSLRMKMIYENYILPHIFEP